MQAPVVSEFRIQICLLFKQEQLEEQNPVNRPKRAGHLINSNLRC